MSGDSHRSPTHDRWDKQRSDKAAHTAHEQSRRCINCHQDCRPRYLYCSDACSDESRAKQRGKPEKEKP